MFKKSIFITILSFIVSIISFCNQLLVAYYFGAKEKTDTFFSITSFPLLLGGVLNISLSYFLIPHIKKQKLILDKVEYEKYLVTFFRDSMLKLFFLFLAFSVLVIIYQKNILQIPINTNNVQLSMLALLTAFFLVVIVILSAFTNADEEYILPIFVSFLPPTFSILLLSIFHNTLSTLSIQWGLLVGAVLGSIILLKKYSNLIFAKNENFQKETISLFYKQMPYAILAMLSFTVYQTIDAYWGSKLGTSNVSYLGYLQRLIVAVGIIVISGPSVILVPKLTEHFIKEDKQEFINLSIKAINWVFILSAFFAVTFSLLSRQLIQLLFQRAAFTQVDTFNIAKVFPYLLIGMCFMLSFSILFRIFFIKDNIKHSSLIGILSTMLYFLFSGFFSSFLQLKGICIAYLLSWIVIFFVAAYHTFKQYNNAFFNTKQFFFAIKTILLCILTTVFFKLIFNKTEVIQGYTLQVISTVWRTVIIAFFFVISGIYILKIKELKEIVYSLKKLINNSNKKIINEQRNKTAL